MYYEPPARRPRRRERSILDSPLLAASLAVVLLGLAAIVLIPVLLNSSGSVAQGSQLPTGGAPPTPTPAPTFARPTPSPAPTFLTYTVKAGDTLNSIAKRYRTTGRSIAWWNRGRYPSLDPESATYDPNTIRRGWVLVLLPDTVVDDDNPPTPSPGPRGSPAAS
jgi:LysM domain-containing protein